jgi:nucleoid DNA-binding protein
MNLIVGKQPLEASRAEQLDLISAKTGLKTQDLMLVIDIFSFFIRKRLLENGCVCVFGIGKFYVIPFNYELYGHKYHTVGFNASDDFRERVKGTKSSMIEYCVPFVEQLKIISKMFGIKIKDVRFLFCYYLTTISTVLRKYKEYRLHRIGTFRLVQKPELALSGVSKRWNCKIIPNTIEFTLADPFFRELNKQSKQYSVYERPKQMLYLVGMSRDIHRKELEKEHDYSKDKGR